MTTVSTTYLNNRINPLAQPGIPLWIAYVFVFTVFSRELGHAYIAGIDYDMIGYNFFILYFLYRLRQFYLNRSIMILLFFIVLLGIISKFYLHLSILPFWKQIVPIALIYLATYDFLYRYDYKKLFAIYFQVSYLTAIFGIIQFLLKLFFGIRVLTPYSSLFLDSIAAEPSHYTVIIMPAVIYGLFYFRSFKKEAAVLLTALILTTSTTAYVVLMVMLLVLYRRIQYLIFIVPVLYFAFNKILLNDEGFIFRYEGFDSYLRGQGFKKVHAGTSLSFLTNWEVALYSLRNSPLIGSGLGGHEEMYVRYFAHSSWRFSRLFGINAASGHSLIIRILSETGLIGLFGYIYVLFKSLLYRADNYHRIISIACLSHFVCKALKLGGYFDYGTPFFAMVLLFNFMDYRSKQNAGAEHTG